jgi:hypothetical protein
MRLSPSFAVLALAAAVVLPACTTTQSTRAKVLKHATEATAQTVRDCRTLTVLPFAVPAGKGVETGAGPALGRDVAHRLGNDFGALFEAVDYADAAKGGAGECVLRGEITKYKKGSKVARFVLIGLGRASLEGHVAVVDGSGMTLLDAPFDKLWAWGGIAGASKGINDMQDEVGASIATTVAQAKGWTPPAK